MGELVGKLWKEQKQLTSHRPPPEKGQPPICAAGYLNRTLSLSIGTEYK
jgi:hypothetical protein